MFYNQVYDKYFYLPTTMFYDNETFISTEGLIKRTTKLFQLEKNNWQILRKNVLIFKDEFNVIK
jgi:two-component SAPR family response regulator